MDAAGPAQTPSFGRSTGCRDHRYSTHSCASRPTWTAPGDRPDRSVVGRRSGGAPRFAGPRLWLAWCRLSLQRRLEWPSSARVWLGLPLRTNCPRRGLKPVVHEGSTRLGGRCFSIRSKFPGQIAEHGGEFIDHGHYAIRGLASTLGLQTDSTYNDANAKNYDELWSFDGVEYTHEQATTDYAALHPVILRQRELIGDQCTYKDSSDFARELDQMSLAVWLDKYVPGGRASKLGQLIENALSEELAADSTALSGLWPAWELLEEQRTRLRALLPNLRRVLSYPRRQRPDSAPFGRKARRRGSDGDGPGRRYQDAGWKGAAVADPRFQGFRRGL